MSTSVTVMPLAARTCCPMVMYPVNDAVGLGVGSLVA